MLAGAQRGTWTRFDASAGDDATLQIADWHATRLDEGLGLSKEAAEANVPHAATRVQVYGVYVATTSHACSRLMHAYAACMHVYPACGDS